MQDGWGRWQLGFHALFTLAANCPNLKELTISEEHLEVGQLHLELFLVAMCLSVFLRALKNINAVYFKGFLGFGVARALQSHQVFQSQLSSLFGAQPIEHPS